MSRRLVLRIVLVGLTAVAAVVAHQGAVAAAPGSVAAGPPWISIEYPVNPFDRATRGAHLLVHAYHHGTPMAHPVSGTAEGIVGGERRSMTLRFETTSRVGVYALRRQWPADGAWTLVISVTQGDADRGGVAQALVSLAADGTVSAVHVPTQPSADGALPRRLTTQEIETAVRANARRLALAAAPRG